MTETKLPVGILGNRFITGNSDPQLLRVRVVENNEPLVRISHHKIYTPSRAMIAVSIEDELPQLRKSVATTLVRAVEQLPKDLGFVLILSYRTYEEQLTFFEKQVEYIRSKHTTRLSRTDAELEASRYVADPRKFAPHVTGAAVDVALVKIIKNHVHLCDVGNNLFEHGERSHSNYTNLTAKQMANRKLLAMTMNRAGFTNFPFVFWHFSLGDKLDAYAKNTVAKFSEIRLK